MLTMKATFAAAEREAAQARTTEAMFGKAGRGHVAGGRVFGYRNVRAGDHVERVIVDAEADVIRRIFREIAEGRGYAKVARGSTPMPSLPARPPLGHDRRARDGFRPLYRGRVVYGKTRWSIGGAAYKVPAGERVAHGGGPGAADRARGAVARRA